MNKKEFTVFAAAIRTYFPKESILPNEHALTLWYEMLKDIDLQTAQAFLRSWISNNTWSPSIAEIRQGVADIKEGELMDYGEAWQLVLTSVRKYGSSQSQEALAYIESVNPAAAKATRGVGYYDICMSENVANERANFRKIYEVEREKLKRDRVLSIELKEQIKALGDNAERRLNG